MPGEPKQEKMEESFEPEKDGEEAKTRNNNNLYSCWHSFIHPFIQLPMCRLLNRSFVHINFNSYNHHAKVNYYPQFADQKTSQMLSYRASQQVQNPGLTLLLSGHKAHTLLPIPWQGAREEYLGSDLSVHCSLGDENTG